MPDIVIEVDEDLVGDEGEAELQDWLVPDRARVKRDEPVAELATAKAIVEVPSPADGELRHLVDAGSVVLSGQAIATVAA